MKLSRILAPVTVAAALALTACSGPAAPATTYTPATITTPAPVTPAPVANLATPSATPTPPCEEDEPCFDCHTMGNLVCSPETAPAAVYIPAPAVKSPAVAVQAAVAPDASTQPHRPYNSTHTNLNNTPAPPAPVAKVATPAAAPAVAVVTALQPCTDWADRFNLYNSYNPTNPITLPLSDATAVLICGYVKPSYPAPVAKLDPNAITNRDSTPAPKTVTTGIFKGLPLTPCTPTISAKFAPFTASPVQMLEALYLYKAKFGVDGSAKFVTASCGSDVPGKYVGLPSLTPNVFYAFQK